MYRTRPLALITLIAPLALAAACDPVKDEPAADGAGASDASGKPRKGARKPAARRKPAAKKGKSAGRGSKRKPAGGAKK
jgi:hypothetical protein